MRLQYNHEKGRWMMKVPRNHERLNSCDPDMLMFNGANTDGQIIVDQNATHTYIVKYQTKGEKQSNAARRVLRTQMMDAGSLGERPVVACLHRMLNQEFGERDIGAITQMEPTPRDIGKGPACRCRGDIYPGVTAAATWGTRAGVYCPGAARRCNLDFRSPGCLYDATFHTRLRYIYI